VTDTPTQPKRNLTHVIAHPYLSQYARLFSEVKVMLAAATPTDVNR
jgi:hypothetical protein